MICSYTVMNNAYKIYIHFHLIQIEFFKTIFDKLPKLIYNELEENKTR